MLLWFLGASVVAVWFVFRSPALDYRLVMVGAVLPLGEVALGGPRFAHTLAFSAALLVVVVLATIRRRLLRRRWISLVIGVMLHLVLDGIWMIAEVFWWPVFGLQFPEVPLPELDRALGVTLVLEALGAGCLVWAWRAFGLSDPANRRLFVTQGHLNRSLVGGG